MYTSTRDLRSVLIELQPIKIGRDKNSSQLVEPVPCWVQYELHIGYISTSRHIILGIQD
jgi:hypothetical protein